LTISVADHGPGIPQELLARVFDKFFRVPNSPTGGSGLGLTIAKGFIEAQGGTIAAANRPGGGAIFSLGLPVEEISQALQGTA
jgi:two-component system, OmpR family, sensor histidine kinase KdpD